MKFYFNVYVSNTIGLGRVFLSCLKGSKHPHSEVEGGVQPQEVVCSYIVFLNIC